MYNQYIHTLFARFYLGLLFLVLVITNINSLTIPKDQKSNSVHLEPPNLSGSFRNNRPPLQSLSNVNEKANQIELSTNIDAISPCNGSYIKTNGTTCGLKNIMIGRCYEYQYVKRGLFLSDTK